MEVLVKKLEEKVKKHKEKLKAHKESEEILRAEYENLKENNDEKQERVGDKLLSTVKNIEYHTGKYKAYNKAVAMIKENI